MFLNIICCYITVCYSIKHCLNLITKTRLLKYTESFTTKNGNFSDKKFWYFSYFCSKHRLWVLVRTNEYPQSMFLSRNNKNNVYLCKPQFYYIKMGFKGGQNYIGMFSWCSLTYTTNRKLSGQPMQMNSCSGSVLFSYGKMADFLQQTSISLQMYQLSPPTCRKLLTPRKELDNHHKIYNSAEIYWKRENELHVHHEKRSLSDITLVKALFSIQKYWHFSYFSTKTYVVVLIRSTSPRRF